MVYQNMIIMKKIIFHLMIVLLNLLIKKETHLKEYLMMSILKDKSFRVMVLSLMVNIIC
jgi:hypothetical protein